MSSLRVGKVSAKSWKPVGVGVVTKKRQLSKADEQQIASQLKTYRLDASQTFLDRMNNALSLYDVQRAIHDSNKPGIVRKKLKEAKQACATYLDALGSLPDTAMYLLGGDFNTMCDSAKKAMDVIATATISANNYPAKGKLPDSARLLLGAAVAQAFRDILKSEPTTTKAGPFESVLTIVLGAATSREPDEVHALARRAIAVTVSQDTNGMKVSNLNPKPSN